jgi:flagellar protein FliS
MPYSHAAGAYREREVLSASPPRLVVIVYDHVLTSLARAQQAQRAGKEEARLAALSTAREGIMELVVTIDAEKGGEIARQLQSLYTFFLTSLLDVGVRRDSRLLERVIGMITELRDSFATVAADATRVSAA